jgi:SAM-dependent methyltransferase
VNSSCPACGSSRCLEFFRREAVPIHQHLLHSSAAEARSAPRGALDLARCEDCAFVWNRAFRPELLTYVPGYDNDASSSARFRRHTEDRIEAILADPVQGRSILEIGCGNGAFLRRLCRLGGNRGIGLDPALAATPGDADDRVELRREAFHAGERLPSAEIIVCRHLIEHLAEPVSLVRAIARALGTDRRGAVYLETPSLEWIVDHDAFWDFFYEHCGYFTEAALRAVLARAGLQAIELSRVFDGQYWWVKAAPAGESALPSPPSAISRPPIDRFAERQARALADWHDRIAALSAERPIVVWGAGAKGTTFVQLVDPRAERIEALVDVHPGKQSRYVPGSGHRIERPEWLQGGPPRTALVMNPAYVAEIRAWLDHHGSPVLLEATGSA